MSQSENRKAYLREYSQRPEVRERAKEKYKRYRERHKEKLKEYWHQHRQKPEIKENIIKRQKEYRERPEIKERYKTNRDTPEFKTKWNNYLKEYRQRPEAKVKIYANWRRYFMSNMEYRENRNTNQKRYHLKNRLTVLKFYSKGTMECACCHEKQLEFLAIDHINGKNHPDILKHNMKYDSGCGLHRDLIKAGFPDGFQVLCHNCNVAKGIYGVCPHQRVA